MAQAYEQFTEFHTRLGGKQISYYSKPGLPSWDKITPATVLLAEHVDLPSDGSALLLECGHAALAAALAKSTPSCRLGLMDNNYIALQACAKTIDANHIDHASIYEDIHIDPQLKNKIDVAILEIPKGRKLSQRWLALAYMVLRPHGLLYLAGANNLGARSVIKDAEALFGPSSVLAYKKGNRIVRLVKDPNLTLNTDWATMDGIAPGTWVEIELQTPQGVFNLVTLPGIFSYDRLDDGTRLLLSHLNVSSNNQVLDLGCGCGVIGLAAKAAGAGDISLLDSNLLAVAAARKNLERHALDPAQVYASDALSAVRGKQFDLILSNPPFHTGRDVTYQITQAFIQQSWQALKPGGRLTIVSNQFIRYDQLLEDSFRETICLAEDGRYQVWQASK